MFTKHIMLFFLVTLEVSSLKYLLVSLENSSAHLSVRKARGFPEDGGNIF